MSLPTPLTARGSRGGDLREAPDRAPPSEDQWSAAIEPWGSGCKSREFRV